VKLSDSVSTQATVVCGQGSAPGGQRRARRVAARSSGY
jgi:hypothetical protein